MSTETKAYDGKHVTNALAGLSLQTTLLMGLPMEFKQKSTLNEHLAINREAIPNGSTRPVMQYLCLGNGGHVVSAEDNLATPIPIEHQPTDAAPYNIIPLVMRPVDKDLSDELRENYALRKQVEYGGRRYWAYYLKRLDWRGVRVKEYYTKVRDGIKTVTDFEYSDKNLYPTAPDMPDYNYEVSDQVTPNDGDYVHSSASTRIELNAFDVQELLNMAQIIYGDPRKAVVSEFCLTSGVDTIVTGESAVGSPFQYMECMGTQINIFLTTFTNMAYQNKGVAYTLDVGNTEPMVLAPGQIPSQTGVSSEAIPTVGNTLV